VDSDGRVTQRLVARVQRDFPELGSAGEVVRLLADASDSERVHAAIVFSSSGNMEWLRDALALAKLDWRDVLVNGGLATEGSPAIQDAELAPQGPHA
jgi:hypothetical protein